MSSGLGGFTAEAVGNQTVKTALLAVLVVPAQVFPALTAVGVLPAIAAKPTVFVGGQATDTTARCVPETAYVVENTHRVAKAVLVAESNFGGGLFSGDGLLANAAVNHRATVGFLELLE
jgi:hypothetical protein